MTESEREKLVTDLANYVAMMAPHQKERMGGKLILRAFEALKVLRVLDRSLTNPDLTESEHRTKLTKEWPINPAWKTAEWGIIAFENPLPSTFPNHVPMKQHGPDTNGPDVGGTDPSN